MGDFSKFPRQEAPKAGNSEAKRRLQEQSKAEAVRSIRQVGHVVRRAWNMATVLGVDSPFFSAIALSKTSHFPRAFGGFLERRITGKNGEVTPKTVFATFAGQ